MSRGEENNLPVEENPYWREKWGPLGEGWLIPSPGDMSFRISRRSEFGINSGKSKGLSGKMCNNEVLRVNTEHILVNLQ